ncbi:hypothetical protein ACVWWK_005547 [Bradyrhizobium sp. LB9.1b]
MTAKRDGLLALAPWPLKPSAPTPEQLAMLAATTGPTDALVSPAWVLPIFDHADFTDPAAEAEIGWVIDLVTQIRSVRAEMNIAPATLTALVLAGASTETKDRAPRWSDVIKRMARLSDISFADHAPDGAVQLLVRGEVAALPLKGVIDVAAERTRLDKEIAGKPTPTSSAPSPSWPTRSSSPTRPRKSSRKSARSVRPRSLAEPSCWRRWSG